LSPFQQLLPVLLALLLVLQLAPAKAAPAAPALAAPVPAHIAHELGAARLAGRGDFTWFGLAIYSAEFWTGPQGYNPAAATAAPYVLDLRYARALNGRRIADASAEQMEKAGAGTPAQRAAWLARMTLVFPDVEAGTHISGVYLPGRGARFYRDGVLLADVADSAFAEAFFGIWLAPTSTAPRLRADLLRDAAPRP
jgi:hypothetical protein